MTLRAENLSLTVGNEIHLHSVGFELARGRLYTVIGRTLAGKTTLLKTIAGLQEPDGGTITLDGTPFADLPVWRRGVAMVYQQFINYPHLCVLDNVTFPLRRAGIPEDEAVRRSRSALATVGLAGFESRRPSELSGGQQQRVALARALVKRSGLLLLDEPVANLDYKLREQLREEFRSLLSDQRESIVIYTTTEPPEAMMLGDVVIVMHEGRLLQMGPPSEIYEKPASVEVARIINDPPMNILKGRIEDGRLRVGHEYAAAVPAHMRAVQPGEYQFGIRAIDLHVVEHGIGTELELAEVSGSETFLHVRGSVGAMVLQIEGIHGYGLYDRVQVELPANKVFVFSMNGELVSAPVAEGI